MDVNGGTVGEGAGKGDGWGGWLAGGCGAGVIWGVLVGWGLWGRWLGVGRGCELGGSVGWESGGGDETRRPRPVGEDRGRQESESCC